MYHLRLCASGIMFSAGILTSLFLLSLVTFLLILRMRKIMKDIWDWHWLLVREHKLYERLSNYKYRIHYLGHIISDEGISVDPEKIEAIMNFPTLINVTDVRSFMGLVGYYRRFIEWFSKVSNSITSLQNKGIKLEWTPRCEESFQQLKNLLTSAPVLKNYKPRKIFCGVYWDIWSTIWRISYARQPRGMLWVKKVEGSWEEIFYSWSGTCIHSTCSQDVETLLDGKKIRVKERSLRYEVFVWSSYSKC